MSFAAGTAIVNVTDASLMERLGRRAKEVGVELTPAELGRMARYALLVEHWNQRINLTALPLRGFPDDTIGRLLIEPLIAAGFIENVPLSWFDLGSGGGSPAIPLKVVRPALRLHMVEARSKRAAFLRETVRALELVEARVLTMRIEALAEGGFREEADLVTVRGVRFEGAVGDAVGSLLRRGGRLFVFGTEATPLRLSREFDLVGEAPLARPGTVLHMAARRM